MLSPSHEYDLFGAFILPNFFDVVATVDSMVSRIGNSNGAIGPIRDTIELNKWKPLQVNRIPGETGEQSL